MTYDRHLRDFYDGLHHGYPSGVYGALGVSLREAQKPYEPPPPPPEPVVPAFTPPRVPVTDRWDGFFEPAPRKAQEQESAEDRRRRHLREFVARKPRLKARLTGKVRCFLDKDGNLRVDSDGAFRPALIIPREEALVRLRRAYRRYWKGRLEEARNAEFRYAGHTVADAEERLDLMRHGVYIAPISRFGRRPMTDLFRRSRIPFSSKIVRRREYRVSLREYDRRMRLFFRRVYNKETLREFGPSIASLPCAEVFEVFLRYPHTGLANPGPDRQFRLPLRPQSMWIIGE